MIGFRVLGPIVVLFALVVAAGWLFSRNRAKRRTGHNGRGAAGSETELCPSPEQGDEFWLRAADTSVSGRLKTEWNFWPECQREHVSDILEQSGYIHRLLHLLQEGKGPDRLEAAELLGMVQVARAALPLFDAMADRNEALALEATRALIRINNPQIVKPLMQALEQPLRRPPARIADVLIGMGSESVQPLIDYLPLLNEKARCLAIDILGQFQDCRAVPALIGLVSGEDAPTRLSAIRALGEIKEKEALSCLSQALGDQDQRVRAAAAQALGQMGVPEAAPGPTRAQTDPDWLAQTAASEAPGKMGRSI